MTEVAERILSILVLEGKVDVADVERLRKEIIPDLSSETKRLVDAFHTLCCSQDHAINCHFYAEEADTTKDPWKQKYHRIWTDWMLDHLDHYGIEVDAALVLLQRAVRTAQTLQGLSINTRDFVLDILGQLTTPYQRPENCPVSPDGALFPSAALVESLHPKS
jgi:hypothetical protein